MTILTDRVFGASPALGMKAPVIVATTANITLSGLQTIDGVTVVAEDRVLVKDQTDTTENGVYIAGTSTWSRAPDFDGNRDVTQGTMIFVAQGTAGAATLWHLTTTGTITIGTSAITFSQFV